MIETGKIINGDCVEVLKTFPESFIDLIVTSPPYGVGIAYDVHNDDVYFEEYLKFSEDWLTQAFRVLKDDGRVAINIPYEINRQDKGGRIFFVSGYSKSATASLGLGKCVFSGMQQTFILAAKPATTPLKESSMTRHF